MARTVPKTPHGSFAVPNSIVQGLTTANPAGLNRLTSFQMVTLFGLIAHISPTHPQKEVRIKVSDILEIIRVGKNVTHAVDRCWPVSGGQVKRKRYQAARYSPKRLEQVHDALLALHNQAVAIHYFDAKSGQKTSERIVHILDSFGYVYAHNGQQLDVHDLPPDRDRINIGTDDRPVYRVRRRTPGGDYFERAKGVTFRLNRELAREIHGIKGTIKFTLFAHRVFELFRGFMRSPAAVRLMVLILRQTQTEFVRCLTQMLDDLGFDVTHPERALESLQQVLSRLRDSEIVTAFSIDQDTDRITMTLNRGWFREPGEG